MAGETDYARHHHHAGMGVTDLRECTELWQKQIGIDSEHCLDDECNAVRGASMLRHVR